MESAKSIFMVLGEALFAALVLAVAALWGVACALAPAAIIKRCWLYLTACAAHGGKKQ